jgi:imidazole glycerol-phosphate synthase subunit HisH
MKVAVINYGMGNLNSVRRSFEEIGAHVIIACEPSVLFDADRIVLPGVGAFSEGMEHLKVGGWVPVLNDIVKVKKKPLLGICLGMQVLASKGHEGTETSGLDFISGEVKKINSLGCGERIPHMGWNEVHYKMKNLMFEGIPDSSDFYFVHSYAFVPTNPINLVATVDYGSELTAVVQKENIFGCQFHPEKSSKAGRQMLRNFMSYSLC